MLVNNLLEEKSAISASTQQGKGKFSQGKGGTVSKRQDSVLMKIESSYSEVCMLHILRCFRFR